MFSYLVVTGMGVNMIRAEFRELFDDHYEVASVMEWDNGRLDSHRYRMLLDELQYQAQETDAEIISCWIECDGRTVGSMSCSFDFDSGIKDCKDSGYYFFQHVTAISNECSSCLRTSYKL